MTSRIDAINITCRDHEAAGAFWKQLLGLREDPDNPNLPGDPVTELIAHQVRVSFLFQPVDEGREFEPRIHFDVDPVDGTRDEEVQRLIALGAETVADRRREDGTGWVTLRGPDGYEVCVQRSAAEIAAAAS